MQKTTDRKARNLFYLNLISSLPILIPHIRKNKPPLLQCSQRRFIDSKLYRRILLPQSRSVGAEHQNETPAETS